MRLPKKAREWLDVLTTVLGTLIVCIVTWQSVIWVHYTYKSGFTSPGILETPMWIPMSVVPLGLFLWSLQYIVESVKAVNIVRGRHPKATEGVTHV
jgi:TRAP-type mannitol/chloroaromatic compound transport system permease small subunit